MIFYIKVSRLERCNLTHLGLAVILTHYAHGLGVGLPAADPGPGPDPSALGDPATGPDWVRIRFTCPQSPVRLSPVVLKQKKMSTDPGELDHS